MKTVLITGGAKRLGKAIVEHFASKGWQVLFTARHSFEDGVQLAHDLSTRHGMPVICTRGSVSNRIDAASIANWVRTQTGSLDLLVCNASSFERIPFEETRQDQFDDLIESNLTGPYFLAQQCLDLLTAGKGAIVNIADAQVQSGSPGFSAYLAAKAGLVSITKSLALELSPTIRVNAILPGSLPWPVNDAYPPAEIEKMTMEIPLLRTGEWSEIVGAVEYLSSASYVTGTCLNIDGGRSARY